MFGTSVLFDGIMLSGGHLWISIVFVCGLKREREKPPPSLNATGTVDKAALRNQRFAVEALGLGLFAGADAADGGMAWTSRWVVFPKTQKMPMDTNANAPAITRNQNPGMRGLLVRRLWRLAIVS